MMRIKQTTGAHDCSRFRPHLCAFTQRTDRDTCEAQQYIPGAKNSVDQRFSNGWVPTVENGQTTVGFQTVDKRLINGFALNVGNACWLENRV